MGPKVGVLDEGNKDRVVTFPEPLIIPIQNHLKVVF